MRRKEEIKGARGRNLLGEQLHLGLAPGNTHHVTAEGTMGSGQDGAAGPGPAGIRPVQTLRLQEFSAETGLTQPGIPEKTK